MSFKDSHYYLLLPTMAFKLEGPNPLTSLQLQSPNIFALPLLSTSCLSVSVLLKYN